MSGSRMCPFVAPLVAILIVLAIGATVEAPATAANGKLKCGDKAATFVGTDRSETIVGTAKADVIVALGGDDTVRGLGGADLICGGGGQDRLLGGAGKDKSLGGAGNDRLNGGTGLDTCLQGSGRGAIRNCEFPSTVPAPIPARGTGSRPAPKPDSDGDGFTDDVDACPAEGASAWGLDGSGCPLPPPKVLVIAYTEVDGVPGYTTGDVTSAWCWTRAGTATQVLATPSRWDAIHRPDGLGLRRLGREEPRGGRLQHVRP